MSTEIQKLKKAYPHHDWMRKDYLAYCKRCGMSSVTPAGECKPWPKPRKETL